VRTGPVRRTVTLILRIDTIDPEYYTIADGDGQTTAARKQASMWVATQDLPRSAAHPFYTRLNQILDEHDFDGYVLLIGYFKGLDAPDTAVAS
jgi:hypothetical protein